MEVNFIGAMIKNGIKNNFDPIEIRNKKQNTHVMLEKRLQIT